MQLFIEGLRLGGISGDVIWGKKYEKGKKNEKILKKGRKGKQKEKMGCKRVN